MSNLYQGCVEANDVEVHATQFKEKLPSSKSVLQLLLPLLDVVHG